MKTTELIRWALQMTEQGFTHLVSDMRDAALTRSTPGNGNHAIWTLGHLCCLEGAIRHVLVGETSPVEHWEQLFAPGTTPKDDAGAYPPFDDLVAKFRELRAYNIQMLEKIGDGGLDRVPKNIPKGFEDAMKTFGHTFLLIALHSMVHYGEIADARRMAGRKPLF